MAHTHSVTLGRLAAKAAKAALLLAAAAGPSVAATCDDPTFATAVSLGLNPLQIHAGDVNGDGKLDLVSVENGFVKVVFGNGDGTFQSPLTAPGLASPSASVVGSWNSDGMADLAVASGVDVRAYLGGALGFTLANGPYPVGEPVRSLATADFDRDGQADALVVGSGVDVYVLPGNGDGTFGSAQPSTLGPADVVEVGDFDGDLYPDLAILQRATNAVRVFRNDGAGGFVTTAVSVNPFPDAAQDLETEDFNKDGRLDLAVVSKAPGKGINVRFGNGNGTFGSPIFTDPATNDPETITVGNFDGDAFADLAVTLQGSVDFEILLGTGNGTFAPSTSQSLGGGSPTGEAASDLDGDGLDDFVVAFAGQDRIALNTTGDACVGFVTATSTGGSGPTSGQNVLQWWNPAAAGVTTVRLRYDTAATAAACTPPPDATSGAYPIQDFAYAPGRVTHPHSGLAPGTYYCYSVFAQGGAGWSPPRSVTARPFDTSGPVKWGFTTGASALAPPGNGVGVVHAVANDAAAYAMKKGAGGGTWPDGPPAWKPRGLPAPSQGRPSTVAVTVGAASRVLFLGSQDGHVYALDAQTGDIAWRSPHLGSMVQAAPSGEFVVFGGTHDYVLVGTRNTGVRNVFYALRLADGSQAWAFDGGTRRIGAINSQASVDYAGRRVYFTSLAFGPTDPDNHTVWCVDLDNPYDPRSWSAPVGDVVGSPILRQRRAGEAAGRVYVGSWDGTTGRIHALGADDGAPVWPAPFLTGADGPVKSYVAADRTSPTGRLLFSTTHKLWALDDPPGSTATPATPVWVRDGSASSPEPAGDRIPNPSTPTYLVSGPWIYVGSSNGNVYKLDYASGSKPGATLVPQAATFLGDPLMPAAVGGPTLDLMTTPSFLYVGTEAGVIYAVELQ